MPPSGRKKHIAASSWNWEAQRGRILNLIANSLEINLSLLFGSPDPDENYLSFVVRYVAYLIRSNIRIYKFEGLCEL